MADMLTYTILILSTITTFGLYMILTGVDSPWFAFAEHAFVGTSIGLSVVVSTDYIFRTIVPRIQANPIGNWPTLISVALALMMLLRVSKSTVHFARIPITIATATGIAISVRATIFSGIINQLKATILPLFNLSDIWTLLTNLTVIICVLFVFMYYYYTIEMKGPLKTANKIGKYILFLSFGVLFAQTYMGRLGLLLGHLDGFVKPYFPNMTITVILVIVMLVSTYLLHKRYPDLLKRVTPE